MRSLSDYEGEGGSWLRDGWHDVMIDGWEMRPNPNNDNRGVEFSLKAGEAKQKIMFWLTGPNLKEEGAAKRLAHFVKCCGISKKEFKAYDLDIDRSHQVMVGKTVSVEVARQTRGDPKYGEVIEWQSIDAPKPAPRPQSKFVEPQPPTGDEIPF